VPYSPHLREAASRAAGRLQARSAGYATIARVELTDALELLMLGVLRGADGRPAAFVDVHLERLAPLRAAQGITARDVEASFAEMGAALDEVVAARGSPNAATVHEHLEQAERRALELLDLQRPGR
jgi:hypothetical protein